MSDPYDDALRDWVSVAWSINASYFPSPLNCPDVTDKLGDYLNGGPLTAASNGTRFRIFGQFTPPRPFLVAEHYVAGLGHGHHVVVRGLRNHPPYHYFVLANVRGTVYIMDCFTREPPIPTSDPTRLRNYLVDRGHFTNFQYSSNFDSR